MEPTGRRQPPDGKGLLKPRRAEARPGQAEADAAQPLETLGVGAITGEAGFWPLVSG